VALIDKLSPGGHRPARRAELERILRNLENVLNSRREYGSPLLPELGIRPLSGHSASPAMAAAVMQDVRECIERYEPRLRLDEIAPADAGSPLRMAFILKCTVLTDPHELQISFDTVLNHVDITRR
jgi:type VI secretion system lysozyme-like protein